MGDTRIRAVSKYRLLFEDWWRVLHAQNNYIQHYGSSSIWAMIVWNIGHTGPRIFVCRTYILDNVPAISAGALLFLAEATLTVPKQIKLKINIEWFFQVWEYLKPLSGAFYFCLENHTLLESILGFPKPAYKGTNSAIITTYSSHSTCFCFCFPCVLFLLFCYPHFKIQSVETVYFN